MRVLCIGALTAIALALSGCNTPRAEVAPTNTTAAGGGPSYVEPNESAQGGVSDGAMERATSAQPASDFEESEDIEG